MPLNIFAFFFPALFAHHVFGTRLAHRVFGFRLIIRRWKAVHSHAAILAKDSDLDTALY
jgi:hypothetical protein